MPRRASEQARIGQEVPLDQLQPGDRLYFSVRKEFDHTGIYLGEGRFVHAADERSGVIINSIRDGSWGAHVYGASRPGQ